MSKDIAQLLSEAREMAAEQKFEACAESFAEAFKASPSNPEALRELAAVMLDLDQVDAGLALLSDSIDHANPHVPTLVRIAALLRGQGRLDEAADILAGALAHDMQNEELGAETLALFKQLGREAELFGAAEQAEQAE